MDPETQIPTEATQPQLVTTPAQSAAGQSDVTTRIKQASNEAVKQHVAEQPKRKPGQRGPDKKPRKLPVAGLDNGSNDSLLEDLQAGGCEARLFPPAQTFDEDTVKAIVEGLTGIVEDFGCGFLRAHVLKGTGDKALAETAAQGGKMSEQTRKLIILGGTQCARKYITNTQYAPEIALAGGLGLYALGVIGQAKKFTAKLDEVKAE